MARDPLEVDLTGPPEKSNSTLNVKAKLCVRRGVRLTLSNSDGILVVNQEHYPSNAKIGVYQEGESLI